MDLNWGVLGRHKVLEGISKDTNLSTNLYGSFIDITDQLNVYEHDVGNSIAIKKGPAGRHYAWRWHCF